MPRKVLLAALALLLLATAGLADSKEAGKVRRVDRQKRFVVVAYGSPERVQAVPLSRITVYDRKGNEVDDVPESWSDTPVEVTIRKTEKTTEITAIKFKEKP
jgi:hypothetical protein